MRRKVTEIVDLPSPETPGYAAQDRGVDVAKVLEYVRQVKVEMRAEGMLGLLSVHHRGQPHSGEIIEFSMKLMARSLPAQQAKDVIRDVMTSAYPLAEEGRDYQVPSMRLPLAHVHVHKIHTLKLNVNVIVNTALGNAGAISVDVPEVSELPACCQQQPDDPGVQRCG